MKNKKILLANSLLLLALSLFILTPIIVNKLFHLKGVISGNVSLLLSGSASVIALGGIALLYCKITNRSFKNVMVIKKISIKQLTLIMFVAIGTYIFAVGVNSVSMKLFPITIKDGMAISRILSGSSTLLGLIVVVFVPAFFEEVFFRGIFLDAYEGVNKKLKYLIVTTIFATFHGNLMQIIYVMFLGFILLKVREYTGSLVGSMTLHATNNAISFILSKITMHYMKLVDSGIKSGVIDSAKTTTATDVMNVSFPVVILRASIFFLIGGAILYINLRNLKEYKEEKESLEFLDEEYTLRDKKDIKIYTDKREYIPLAIYFVSMIAIVFFRY